MDKEYLIEIQRIGSLLRANAIDPQTNIEVVVQGPLSAGEAALKQLAVRKLLYRLSRNKTDDEM